MFPIRAYIVVAAAIALVSFGIGQLEPGLGVAFAALASTMWTAYSVRRRQRLQRGCSG